MAIGIEQTVTSFDTRPPPGDSKANAVDVDDSIKKKKKKDSKNNEDDDKYSDASPVSFFSLFRHGTPKDKLIITIGILVQCCVGCSLAAINLVFGEVLDDLSSVSVGSSILDSTIGTIKIMAILAVVFGALAFVGMSAIPYGAARITNQVRNAYVSAVLAQDMTYFDESRPGEIVAALSDYTMDFEEGLGIKLGEGLQATFGGLGGLAVALYFSWQITVRFTTCFLLSVFELWLQPSHQSLIIFQIRH